MSPIAARRIIGTARTFSGIALLIAVVAILGYLLNQPTLFRVASDLRGMSPLTAIGVAALAVGALAATWRYQRTSAASALAAFSMALLALVAHATSGGDNVSPWLGRLLFAVDPAAVGRTSLATVFAIAAAAAGLWLRRRRPYVADIAAGLALVIAGTALLGYLYGVGDLYRFPLFNSMGLNTSIALALLAVAVLLVEPKLGAAAIVGSDEAGGGATRRQLSFIILPVVAGSVLLKATDAEVVGPAFAMALLVIVTVVPLAILVLRDGHVLNSLDRERRAKIAIQTRMTAKMGEQLAEQAMALAHEGEERSKAEAVMFRAQRMEAVGQLTGGIAHDFNNLLMAIRGNLELAQNRLPPDQERLHRYLDSATAATDKGAKITAQLLAFSRSQRLDIRPVELEPVLAASRELIGNALGPEVKIVLALETSGVWAKTDPDQLELAILNLAVNARDAMPEGGTLRIESTACDPVLSSERDPADYVSILVIDSGTGMTDEVIAKAVEPFFTTKERGKGTGLGLAQVYGFARQCGGDLRITSEVGRGTTVELLLPCAAPIAGKDAQLNNRAGIIPRAKTAGRQVLVIDDDDGVRAVIVDALVSSGFEVIEASDGESGLALLDNASPAAAIIDFLMPGMNGAEVARIAQKRTFIGWSHFRFLRPGLVVSDGQLLTGRHRKAVRRWRCAVTAAWTRFSRSTVAARCSAKGGSRRGPESYMIL